MKLGVVAGTVAGGLLVAAGPTAVWLVAANEFGDSGDGSVRVDRVERRLDRFDDRFGGPGRPWLEGRPPEGQLRDRAEELRELAAWTRCVLEQAREAEGPVDLEEECGEAPELAEPRSLTEPPPMPEFQDS